MNWDCTKERSVESGKFRLAFYGFSILLVYPLCGGSRCHDASLCYLLALEDKMAPSGHLEASLLFNSERNSSYERIL